MSHWATSQWCSHDGCRLFPHDECTSRLTLINFDCSIFQQRSAKPVERVYWSVMSLSANCTCVGMAQRGSGGGYRRDTSDWHYYWNHFVHIHLVWVQNCLQTSPFNGGFTPINCSLCYTFAWFLWSHKAPLFSGICWKLFGGMFYSVNERKVKTRHVGELIQLLAAAF